MESKDEIKAGYDFTRKSAIKLAQAWVDRMVQQYKEPSGLVLRRDSL